MTGYVYLIGSLRHSWFKIGKSRTPNIRIEDLGILLPFKVEIFALWRADNHHWLEAFLHETYSKSRLNGEWFQFRPSRVSEIVFSSLPGAVRVYPNDHPDPAVADLAKVRGVGLGKIEIDLVQRERQTEARIAAQKARKEARKT